MKGKLFLMLRFFLKVFEDILHIFLNIRKTLTIFKYFKTNYKTFVEKIINDTAKC